MSWKLPEGSRLVYADEVVGCCTSLGRIVCKECAAAGMRDVPEAFIYAGCTYSDDGCEVCTTRLYALATYWIPPNFPHHLGKTPPDPGFELGVKK